MWTAVRRACTRPERARLVLLNPILGAGIPLTKEIIMSKQRETLSMEEHVLSPGSRERYEGHLKRLDRWLKGREPTDRVLAEYLVYLFEKGLAPSTANGAVAAARWRCGREGQLDPQGRKTKATLRNFRRDGYDRGYGQAEGVNGWTRGRYPTVPCSGP